MYDLMSQFRTVDLGKIDQVIRETNASNQGKVWSWFHGITRTKGKGLATENGLPSIDLWTQSGSIRMR
jgi:hypothetical protein